MPVAVRGEAVMALPAAVGLFAARVSVFGDAVGAAVWAAEVIAIDPCGHSAPRRAVARTASCSPYYHTSACWEIPPRRTPFVTPHRCRIIAL